MSGWYVLTQSSNEQFHFVLKAGNGETILSSEMYDSKQAAQNGIASVQKNCEDDSRYAKETSKLKEPYFNLKAANHQIIGTSEMYSSAQARDGGIASVKTNGPSTDIRILHPA